MKKNIYFFNASIFCISFFSGDIAVLAETQEDEGRAIFVEADKRNHGFVDSAGSLMMVLTSKNGETSEREMNVKVLEGLQADGDKTLIVFESPKDQRGTALLTYQHNSRDDDQWLYLPALKRVKKIASNSRSGPFMGSEFSFEDMGGQQVEEFTYKYLREENYDGQDCFVVESDPKDENSGYSKVVNWIDKQNYRVLKAEFYDKKNSKLKTLSATNYKLYLDKFWRAGELNMVNLQTGKSTKLVTKDLQFITGLKDADFSQNSLQRAH